MSIEERAPGGAPDAATAPTPDVGPATAAPADAAVATAEAPRVAPRPGGRVVTPKKGRPRGGGPPSDPVGDMLTRIRNGVAARHQSVTMPSSRLKAEVARILKSEGFIAGFEQQSGQLVLRLRYVGGKVPAVAGLRRISRPGLRVYRRKTEMPRVLGGLGVAIVSTSSGLMTGREAERKGLGGEIVAHVW